jgi:hypothetical protein
MEKRSKQSFLHRTLKYSLVYVQAMCRSLVSISWDRLVYDCDFNPMLDLYLRETNGKLLRSDSLTADRVASIRQ